MPIPVHVSCRRQAAAEPRPLLAPRLSPRRRRLEPGRTPEEQEGRALVGECSVLPSGPHRHVAIAVPVDIPGRGDGEAELRGDLVPVGGPGRGRLQPRRRSEVQERPPFLLLPVMPCPDDDIREAVAVHVARRRDGVSEVRLCQVGLGGPCRCARQPRRRPEVQVGPAGVRRAAGGVGRADDHVRVPVTVDVPRDRDCGAELAVRLSRLGDPGGRRAEPRPRTQVEVHRTLVRWPAVVEGRRHDEVAEAVPVDVPPRQIVPELRGHLVRHRTPGGGRRQPGRRA